MELNAKLISGLFAGTAESWFPIAKYGVFHEEVPVAVNLDYFSARETRVTLEAKAGISEGDRESPYTVKLLNKEEAYATLH